MIDHLHPAVRAAALIAGCSALLAGCGGSNDAPAPTPTASEATAQQACVALAGKSIGGATVSAAAVVPASGATPLHCKVSASIPPQLNMELDLPQQWNGKLYYAGGGGFNGTVSGLNRFSTIALQQGYAVASSDSGHSSPTPFTADFALDDPYAAAMFGSLSVPTVMASAREMIQATYAKNPDRAYFEGCSNGGREGLMAAQRNPNLFDGIIARAPAYNLTAATGQFNANAKAVNAAGAQLIAAKIQLVARAVRSACDAQDGIADNVVSNLGACSFNAASLRCAGGADTGDACLSDVQLQVVDTWTQPKSFANGASTYPGFALTGNEDDPAGWAQWLTGGGNVRRSAQYLLQDTTVKNYLARDRNADSLSYVWDSNLATLFGTLALNEATNTDLRPLKSSNAKLLLWHGTSDPAISYRATVDYYESMVARVGGRAAADEFVRFYPAPGVLHCSGGPGADQDDLLMALDGWVTQGRAPAVITATKKQADGSTVLARPLCAYPQYPRYTGAANDVAAMAIASNFTCTTP